MGDLKTPYFNPVLSAVDPAGDDIPARGTDPNVALGGTSGLQTPYDNAPFSQFDGQETANSQSGLPLRPARMAPAATPPDPPDLTDRTPGMIDR